MKKVITICAVVIMMLAVSGVADATTYTFGGGSTTTTNTDSWGGYNSQSYDVGGLGFNVNAGPVTIEFLGVNVYPIPWTGDFGWPPDPTDTGASAIVGLGDGTNIAQYSFKSNMSGSGPRGTDPETYGKGSWDHQGVGHWNDDGYRSFLFQGQFTGHWVETVGNSQYNAEKHGGPTGIDPDYDTFDIKMYIEKVAENTYKVTGWHRLWKSSAIDEGCGWDWNYAGNAHDPAKRGYLAAYEGTWTADGGLDLSNVKPFLAIQNWEGTQPQLYTFDWDSVVITQKSVHNVTLGTYYDQIQPAMNEARDGDLITVGAGTYVEQVEITKQVTIIGAGQGSTIIQSPDILPLSYTTSATNKAVVYLHDVCGAVIKDLTVDGAGKGNANYRFQGIGLFNAGATIDNVGIINIEDTPFSGAQHGVALYAYNEEGAECNVDVLNCTINNFQKNAIAISGTKTIARVEDCNITGAGDTSVTAQNGIQIGYGASGIVKGNNVSGIRYKGLGWSASGILGYGIGGSETISIEDNTISGSQGAIQVYSFNGGTSILNNKISDSNFSYLDSCNKGTVTGNDFSRSSEQGLYLWDVTNIKGAGNSFADGVIGLVVDGASDGVAFENCQFTNNSEAGALITNYESSNPKNVSINNSNFGSSGFGIENDSNGVVDASYNWWGNASGPSDPCGVNEADGKKCYDVTTIKNADGLGDKVSDGNVIYCPWLTAPMTTALKGQCPAGDLDGDCDVDFHDLAILAGNWLVGT